SHCNALSSAMQSYISDGSVKHLRAAVNAHQMILEQSYATGGWGPDEAFVAPHTGGLYDSLTKTHHSFETPCGSYAHFKLTRYLLRVTRDGKYGDSMERVLYNTVMGAKPLQADGRSFYYSDYSNSGSKFYHGDKWPCCSGTLPQVTADYHILGYFRDEQGVYVNLYAPSTLRWISQGGTQMELTQSHSYPLEGRIEMIVRAKKAEQFTLRLRIPGWAGDAAASSIKVNGAPVTASVTKGFAAIPRKWKDGDRVELEMPLPVRLEPIDELHPETVALVRGPLVLFGLTEDPGKVTRQALLSAQHVKGQALWQTGSENGALLLVPFTEIHEEKYRTYFEVS
ncbi:MAG TPA: beta-L-arabinofuranosidase domain-containing protein, partial [Acidobacteriaceae bacterium]